MDIFDILLRYGNFDPEVRTLLGENMYYRIGALMLSENFKCESIPYNTFKVCELILNLNGHACLGRNKKGEIVAGYPIFDDIDDNLVPILTGARTLKGDDMTDYFLIRNNVLMKGEHLIMSKYAYQLAKLDFSQGKLLDKSVCNPIPVAKSQEVYEGIKDCLKNCGNDDIKVLKVQGGWGDTVGDLKDYDVIDFTNVAYADKFKYLSSYHNDLTSRAFFLYGFALQSPTKQAQTTTDELDYRNECSDIYVNSRYNTRYNDYKLACEGLGVEFNFDYSDLWKKINSVEDDPNTDNDNERGNDDELEGTDN